MTVLLRYAIGGRTASQVAASIEEGVRRGAIPAGAPIPTVRALARQLRLSPATVAAAYRLLRGRGLLATDGRRGTRVTPRPPVAGPSPAPVPAHLRNLAEGSPDPALLP